MVACRRQLVLGWCVAVVGLCCGRAVAARDVVDLNVPPSPKAVVQRLHDLLIKGDVKEAATLFDVESQLEAGQAPAVDEFLKGLAETMLGGGVGFVVLDDKDDGPCAVVVVNETSDNGQRTKDHDLVCLVQKNERWRLLPGLDYRELELDRPIVERFQRLEKWYDRYVVQAVKR